MAFDVFGFGNALVDILIQVDDNHISELDLEKGTFHIVEEERIGELLQKFREKDKKIVPAGSCGNTIFALSWSTTGVSFEYIFDILFSTNCLILSLIVADKLN